MKHIKTFEQLNESFLSDRLDVIKHKLTKLNEAQIKKTLDKVSKVLDVPVSQLGDKELLIRKLNQIKSDYMVESVGSKIMMIIGAIGLFLPPFIQESLEKLVSGTTQIVMIAGLIVFLFGLADSITNSTNVNQYTDED